MSQGPCPGEQHLSAWVSGRLPLQEAEALREHLGQCDACRLVADLLQADRPATTERALKPGQRVGPYHVLEWLGAGGMGAVYAAYDARLDRRLALKVLEHGEQRANVMHEARAMARLNHPNVATVYDVGERDGLAYLAMEILPNGTLREWLRGAPTRGLEEVLRVFVHVARGLAHAHAHGIVHRDFKPDNVMFAADGTPRVADFGLATDTGGKKDEVAGTFAYLAPEVFEGKPTPASDQYAFGVTLKQSLERLAKPAPRAVTALVAKLTAEKPEQRLPSMQAVEAALQNLRPSVRARRRSRAIVAIATPIIAALAIALFFANQQRCAHAGDQAERIWSLLQPGLEPQIASEVRRQLSHWRRQSEEACSAAATPLSDARARCIEEELRAFHGQAEKVSKAKGTRAALLALELLPSPRTCELASQEEADRWQRELARRGTLLARLDAAGTNLEALRALQDDLKPEQDRSAFALVLAATLERQWADRTVCEADTLESLQVLVSAARRAALPALETRAWTDLARCQRQRGSVHQAEFSLAVADEVARALPPEALARQLTSLQRGRLLIHVNRHDDAEAALMEVRARQGWLEGMLFARMALLALARQQPAEAVRLYELAVPLLEASFGADDPETKGARHNLASSLTASYRYEEALALYERAVEESGGELNVSTPLASDLVPVLLALGRDDEALKWARHALDGVAVNDLRTISSMGQQLQAWARAELAAGDPGAVLKRLEALRGLETLSDGHMNHVVERRAFEASALLLLARDRPKAAKAMAAQALALLDAVAERAGASAAPERRQLWAQTRANALAMLDRGGEAVRQLKDLPLDQNAGLDPVERANTWLAVAKSLEQHGQRAQAALLVRKVEPFAKTLGARARRLKV